MSPVSVSSVNGMVIWKDRPWPEKIRGVVNDHIFNCDGLIAAVVRLEPGALIPQHVHEHHDEIFDVMSGSGEILLDGIWQPLESGTTVLVEAGMFHALRNQSDDWLVLRETIRQRVYARAALREAFKKRWRFVNRFFSR